MQVHSSENYIPAVISSPNCTSLPSIAVTFLATCLMVVLQPSGYSIFYNRNTPIWLGLPWQSYSCQCFNTETSAQGNRSYTTKTLSISYSRNSYIRLVVTLTFISLIINEDNFLLNSISGIQWQHTKLVLTPILDFFLFSEIVTMQQTDGTTHKLKPRLFHKSAHLQVHLADFHPGVNHTWYRVN